MGKRKNAAAKTAAAVAALQSNVSPILEFQYEDPIFALAAHPSKNILATGLATGHVHVHSYDAELLEAELASKKQLSRKKIKQNSGELVKLKKQQYWSKIVNGDVDAEPTVNLSWKTKRHKGSCRSVLFDSSGETLYTVGTDKIIKKLSLETGKVITKTGQLSVKTNFTKLIVAPNKPVVVVGSELGHIHVFDTRTMEEVHKVLNVHDDAVSGITHMSALSDYQYLSVGSTTLTHFDVRKGIIQQSENQEDEILSVNFVDPSNCHSAVAGMGEGVVTLWRKDKNDFVDQISRVRVGHDSVDAVISSLEESGDNIWCGSADGYISKVDTRRGKVLEKRVHHAEDEVVGLDVDFDYRLVSFGMERLKIWSNENDSDDEEGSDSEDDSGSEEGSDDDSESGSGPEHSSDSAADSDSNSDSNSDSEGEEEDEKSDDSGSDSEEESSKPRPKSKSPLLAAILKSNPTSDTTPKPQDTPEKKPKAVKKSGKQEKNLTVKQLKNLQQHEHGIRKFEGL